MREPTTAARPATAPAAARVRRPPRDAWHAADVRTVAVGAAMRPSASMARSARYSCTNPSTAARTTMTEITIASVAWPSTADSATATSRMITRTFVNCASRSRQGPTPRAASSSFGPCSASRRAASSDASPEAGEVASAVATVRTSAAC